MALNRSGHRANRVEIIDAADSSVDMVLETESLEWEAGPRTLALAIALFGCVIFLIWAAGNGERAVQRAARTTAPLADEISENGVRHVPNGELQQTMGDRLVWPVPPLDHDPHLVGRPGNQQRIRSYLADKSLLYVNSRGRPTIIDLSTGNQQEVLIADPRVRETFSIEFGQVVGGNPENPDLSASHGRAFTVLAQRSQTPDSDSEKITDPGPEPNTVIPLCLNLRGCGGLSGTATQIRLGTDLARTLTTYDDPTLNIGHLLTTEEWILGGRWTTFVLDEANSAATLRIPTPMFNSVVWIIDQTPD